MGFPAVEGVDTIAAGQFPLPCDGRGEEGAAWLQICGPPQARVAVRSMWIGVASGVGLFG